jgi:hypothetical protein
MKGQQVTKWKLIEVSGVKQRYWTQSIHKKIEEKI